MNRRKALASLAGIPFAVGSLTAAMATVRTKDNPRAPEGVRVLVFADESDDRRTLVDTVRSLGYAVETASDRSDALSRTVTYAPSIVLTDMTLNGRPTLDLVSVLSAYLPHVCVIVFSSGRISSHDIIGALRWGAHDYMEMPVDLGRLRTLLRVGSLVSPNLKQRFDRQKRT